MRCGRQGREVRRVQALHPATSTAATVIERQLRRGRGRPLPREGSQRVQARRGPCKGKTADASATRSPTRSADSAATRRRSSSIAKAKPMVIALPQPGRRRRSRRRAASPARSRASATSATTSSRPSRRPETNSPWGIMSDSNDPVTGEHVAASINVWTHVNDLFSRGLVDTLRYIGGELKTEDITDGTYVNKWVEAARQSKGAGLTPAHGPGRGRQARRRRGGHDGREDERGGSACRRSRASRNEQRQQRASSRTRSSRRPEARRADEGRASTLRRSTRRSTRRA